MTLHPLNRQRLSSMTCSTVLANLKIFRVTYVEVANVVFGAQKV